MYKEHNIEETKTHSHLKAGTDDKSSNGQSFDCLQESKKLVLPTPESQSSNSVKKQQWRQTEEYYESLLERPPVPWLIGHRFTFCIFTSLAHKLMSC